MVTRINLRGIIAKWNKMMILKELCEDMGLPTYDVQELSLEQAMLMVGGSCRRTESGRSLNSRNMHRGGAIACRLLDRAQERLLVGA